MNNLRWWFANPWRVLLGLAMIVLIAIVAYILVKVLVIPLLLALVPILVVLIILRYALTGRIGRHGGG